MNIDYKIKPVLDPGFVPAVMWNRAYKKLTEEKGSMPLLIGLGRKDGTFFRFETHILKPSEKTMNLTVKYVERIVKFLLWQRGGAIIFMSNKAVADEISKNLHL